MKIERSNSPQTNGVIEFHLPKFNKFFLDNGMEVLFVKKDNLPVVQLNMLVNGGSKFDPKSKSGLAHLTALLVDEGAGEYDSLQLDDEIESLGSIFGISTDCDNIHLNMLTLKENLQRSIELLALVYQSPNFTTDDFIREQRKLTSKITQSQDDPSYIANSNFDSILFSETYYKKPVIGNIAEVSALTNREVIDFHKKYYTPSNTQLVVVGHVGSEELQSSLNKYFTVQEETELPKPAKTNPTKQNSKFYFIHKDGAAQSEIRIGHISDRRNETDYFAKVIANSILGGQFSSRLNLNLREDKGFTYGISSGFYYHQDAGYFEISTSVNGKDTGEAIKEIKKEIEGVKHKIKDEEIEFTKSYLVKRFPAMFETSSQIAHNIATMQKYGLSNNYFDNYIDMIIACSKSDIENIAKENIILDELIYLVVGDKETVLPQLKEVTDLDIIELGVNGEVI